MALLAYMKKGLNLPISGVVKQTVGRRNNYFITKQTRNIADRFKQVGSITSFSTSDSNRNIDGDLDVLFERNSHLLMSSSLPKKYSQLNPSKEKTTSEKLNLKKTDLPLSQQLGSNYEKKLLGMDLINKRLFSTTPIRRNQEDFTDQELLAWKNNFDSTSDHGKKNRNIKPIFPHEDFKKDSPWLADFSSFEIQEYLDQYKLNENSEHYKKYWKKD